MASPSLRASVSTLPNGCPIPPCLEDADVPCVELPVRPSGPYRLSSCSSIILCSCSYQKTYALSSFSHTLHLYYHFTRVLTPPADIVQDLYLREVRAYKQPAIKATDAEGHVQKFNMPKAPSSPEERSLSDQMQEYESSTVEIEGQAAAGETPPTEEDYFEDLKEIEEEQPAAH
jgi:F-type H+-transporting ATPase subunit h